VTSLVGWVKNQPIAFINTAIGGFITVLKKHCILNPPYRCYSKDLSKKPPTLRFSYFYFLLGFSAPSQIHLGTQIRGIYSPRQCPVPLFLIGLEAQDQVVRIIFKNGELLPDSPKDRKAIFDLYSTNEKGNKFINLPKIEQDKYHQNLKAHYNNKISNLSKETPND